MAGHLRPGIGIDDGRRGAVELANLRADFRRQRHEDVRVLLAQESRDALLVLRILVGVQQADGDGPDSLILELARDFANRLLLEFRDDVAAGGDAFADAEAVRPADKRIGILDVQIVEVVSALVPDAQHVPEAVCRDEAGLDALTFQNCVRDDRGRTQNLEVLEGDRLPELLEQFRDTLHHSLGRVLWSAQDLVEVKVAVVVQEGEIREGSPGVESQFCHVSQPQLRSLVRRQMSGIDLGHRSFRRYGSVTARASTTTVCRHRLCLWRPLCRQAAGRIPCG